MHVIAADNTDALSTFRRYIPASCGARYTMVRLRIYNADVTAHLDLVSQPLHQGVYFACTLTLNEAVLNFPRFLCEDHCLGCLFAIQPSSVGPRHRALSKQPKQGVKR